MILSSAFILKLYLNPSNSNNYITVCSRSARVVILYETESPTFIIKQHIGWWDAIILILLRVVCLLIDSDRHSKIPTRVVVLDDK